MLYCVVLCCVVSCLLFLTWIDVRKSPLTRLICAASLNHCPFCRFLHLRVATQTVTTRLDSIQASPVLSTSFTRLLGPESSIVFSTFLFFPPSNNTSWDLHNPSLRIWLSLPHNINLLCVKESAISADPPRSLHLIIPSSASTSTNANIVNYHYASSTISTRIRTGILA
jgi:hypothetical protein